LLRNFNAKVGTDYLQTSSQEREATWN